MVVDAKGCHQVCAKVCTVPKTRSIDPPAGRLSEPGEQPLALCIVGVAYSRPFSQATANQKFVLIAVDYFTKWVEAYALPNVWDVDVKKFVWRNIVTRFGVLNSLISNNWLQFDSRAFREFCSNLGIKNKYSTPAYPQSNGQVEATNKAIVNGLKKSLDGEKGRWAKELPNIL